MWLSLAYKEGEPFHLPSPLPGVGVSQPRRNHRTPSHAPGVSRQHSGRELTQACLTVHTGFREIKRTVEDGASSSDAMRLSFSAEESDADKTLARDVSSLSVGGDVKEVEKFGFGSEFDFQSEAQLGEYMEHLAEQEVRWLLRPASRSCTSAAGQTIDSGTFHEPHLTSSGAARYPRP